MRYPRSRRALTPPTCLNAYSSKGRMLHAWCPVAGAKQIRGELDRLLAGRNSDGAKFVSVVDFGATLQLSSPGDAKPRARWKLPRFLPRFPTGRRHCGTRHPRALPETVGPVGRASQPRPAPLSQLEPHETATARIAGRPEREEHW